VIETQTIGYRDDNTTLNGFLARDREHRDPRPGILVVHGGAGLDDHARSRAIRFAERGFVAFACDMYGESVGGNRDRVIQQITEFRRDPDSLCSRAKAGLDVLASLSFVTERRAAVGYCFGGMTVLELARNSFELAGVVSVHGALDTVRPAQPGSIQTKLLICHGALDPHVPMSHLNAFTAEMIQARADWQLVIYGRAMHGFTHEPATGKQPGVAYHAPSDVRSGIAIQEFFKEIFEK